MSSSFTDADQILSTIGIVLLVLFTLLGNSFVLIVLTCKARRLFKKPLYLFICNICFADILATLFTMTFEGSEEITHEWIFGEATCKAIEYLEMTLFGVNIFTHFSIAVERYRNVVQPLKPQMKIKTAKILLAVTWGVPSFMSLPYLYTLRVLDVNGQKLCTSVTMPWTWLDKLFLSVELFVVFLVPLACIVWMYFIIVRRLYRRRQQANTMFPANNSMTMHAAATHGSRVSIVVVFVFVVCWLPFILVYIVRIFTSSENVHRTSALYLTALYSSFVSELLTPILYCAFDRNIRPALVNTLRCRRRAAVVPSDDSQSDVTAPRSRNGTFIQPADLPSREDAPLPKNGIIT